MKKLLITTLSLFLLSILLIYLNISFLLVFFVIVITLVLGSKLLGNATEELANYYSTTLGGLLSATLGNLAELIIGFFALKEGLTEVVKASLTGSIIGNILLVFGGAVFVGGFKFKEQKLKKHETEISSTMLLLACLFLVLPSILGLFNEQAKTQEISLTVAIGLIILYFALLIYSFYTHKEYFASDIKEKPKMKKKNAFALMAISIIILGIVSELFASRIEEFAHSAGLGELFIGAILVGIVGNAAEHLSALQFAKKGKMSLVLNSTIGSSMQIAMFVAPILFFASAIMNKGMSLAFLPIEIIAIIFSVILINEISRDGEVNWIEGLQLIFLYIVLAIVFFFY
jgi:Ca2+:H+ antiporter